MDYVIESKFDTENNFWDVGISGEVDIFTSENLRTALMNLINQTEADLKIDCENLVYLDSTAIGSLVAVLKNVKKYNGNVYIYNLKPSLLKLFRITNLDKVFITEVS